MNNQYNLTHFESTFREFLISQSVAPVTIKNYLSDLRHFFGWTSYKSQISNVPTSPRLSGESKSQIAIVQNFTSNDIQNYFNYQINGNIPTKSINRRLSTLRKFFSFCISQGWITHNPAKKVINITSVNHPEFNSGSTNKDHSNNLILTTDIIEKNQLSEKELLAKYSDSLQNNKLNEKEILQIMGDLKEFFTIINFRPKADPVINL